MLVAKIPQRAPQPCPRQGEPLRAGRREGTRAAALGILETPCRVAPVDRVHLYERLEKTPTLVERGHAVLVA